MTDTTRIIQTQSMKDLKGHLKKIENVQNQGKTYSLTEYDIENYGLATYLENMKYNGEEFRRSLSMMPFEYMDKMAKDFHWNIYKGEIAEYNKNLVNNFILSFDKFKEHGKGLYIYSGTRGSGKTLLACCLVNEVSNRYIINAKFINILDYLELTKKGYNSTIDKEERDNIERASLLILDDIGVELAKDWVNTTLYRLINYRYSNKLITIITSNVEIEKLKIDGRIKDRINAMCIPLRMPEESIRGQQATAENNEFLKSLGKG